MIPASCRDLIAALCDVIATCDPVALRRDYGDVASCTARESLACGSLSLPGSSWTEQDFAQCKQQVMTSGCALDFERGACAGKPGTLPDGTGCEQSLQCAGGRCDIKVISNADGGFNVPSCGVCLTPDAGTGASCGTGPACPASERCIYDNGAYRCAVPQPEGAPCTGGAGCAEGLVCKGGAADGGTMFCARRSMAGAPCTFSSECDPQAGLRCVSGFCGAPTFVPLGAACDGSGRICELGARCHYASGATAGICETPAGDGMPCGGGGPSCSDPASCRDGICRLPGEANCH